MVGRRVLLVVEVGEGRADEADPVVSREVAEGVVGGEQDALAFGHGLDRLRHPRVEGTQVLQVRGRGRIDRRGGVGRGGSEACAEVTNLDAGTHRRGPHVGVEAEFGFFARVFRRERPGGDLNALVATVNRVGSLRVGGTRLVDVGGGQDAGGDDHASVEAGGGDRVVEEVLEVDAGHGHDVGLSQGGGLSGSHLMLVRRGIGGQQAG